MSRPPGFIDESVESVAPIAAPDTRILDKSPDGAAHSGPAGPTLFEPEPDARVGRVDHGELPRVSRPPRVRGGSLPWLVTGLAVLVVGWSALSAVAFSHDQFVRSRWLGWLTLGVFGSAALLLARGALAELRSYRALQRVDTIRVALTRGALSVAEGRTLSRRWLNTVERRLPDPGVVQVAIDSAATIEELRAILRARVLAPLDAAVRQHSAAAAIQGGAIIAVVPSPSLEGIVMFISALALVREVAHLYGLRPGVAATYALLRKVGWDAATVSGADLLAQTAADHLLHNAPVLKYFAGTIPGTSIAARRLYRLGLVAAKACSPLEGV